MFSPRTPSRVSRGWDCRRSEMGPNAGNVRSGAARKATERFAAMADRGLRVARFGERLAVAAGRKRSGRSRSRRAPSASGEMRPSTVPRVSNSTRSPRTSASAQTNRAGLSRSRPLRAARRRSARTSPDTAGRRRRTAPTRRRARRRARRSRGRSPPPPSARRSPRRSTAPWPARSPRTCCRSPPAREPRASRERHDARPACRRAVARSRATFVGVGQSRKPTSASANPTTIARSASSALIVSRVGRGRRPEGRPPGEWWKAGRPAGDWLNGKNYCPAGAGRSRRSTENQAAPA